MTSAKHDPSSQLQAAQALWRQNRVESARELLESLLVQHPGHAEATGLLAQLLQSQGQLGAASQVMAAQARATGLVPPDTLRCAQFIQQCRRQPLAAALCEEAIAAGKADADLLALAGNLARELGDFGTARVRYEAALAAGVDLDRWFVLGALAATRRYATPDDPDFARLSAHFRQPDASAPARAASGFGLAKAYDDIGDYASAAATLREANRLARQARGWSRADWSQWLAQRLQAPPAGPALAPAADFVPIFIVGLPRSGTTLAATRLDRHTLVRNRDESPMLSYLATQLQASGLQHRGEALRQAAALYRQHAVQDDPPVRWYIDKDPNNFRYLDLVAALFPQARVIHCRRDPRDVALSIWSQDFAHPHYALASDLGDIADFIQGHDRLMRHWRDTLALPIHELDYEAMVADPAGTLAAVRRFVGLPADAADAPSPAAIGSASVWQARQPIYATSVGRWRHYLPWVPELALY